jgi:RHS repeat-associated protein
VRFQLSCTVNCFAQQFTLKERDVETGLDYFDARYYASIQGRFTSPDPLLASGQAKLPQSWNRYTYGVNNPLINVDPTGLWWYTKDGGDGHPQWFDEDPGKGYTTFTQYSYYAGEKYGYVALDPYSRNFQIGFDTEEEASGYSNQLAGETLQARDPGQYVSQLDGTMEVATYISGVQAVARIGIAAGETLLARRAAQETATGLTEVATQATIHGAERLAARGFSEADIALTKTGVQFLQRDGATVFLKEVTPGKFNVIVEGGRGVVTALKNVSEKSVARLSANYGWFSPIAK